MRVICKRGAYCSSLPTGKNTSHLCELFVRGIDTSNEKLDATGQAHPDPSSRAGHVTGQRSTSKFFGIISRSSIALSRILAIHGESGGQGQDLNASQVSRTGFLSSTSAQRRGFEMLFFSDDWSRLRHDSRVDKRRKSCKGEKAHIELLRMLVSHVWLPDSQNDILKELTMPVNCGRSKPIVETWRIALGRARLAHTSAMHKRHFWLWICEPAGWATESSARANTVNLGGRDVLSFVSQSIGRCRYLSSGLPRMKHGWSDVRY
ncbi:uncharacterized protein BCR38DRAFT_87582 [Pseudomassariella vexata]|uniref:Uncharacterized protein n=1 Tax=Pseudomassariella vexata TaxID=1141098 RepID=A0A1Y2EE07_9PEZI|nr:uncharacterized protein BCR38DRAFT_87582 [Pseudomassariella vexata]ORY69544.1 hypothetical protein BCR38DRAFT_87582 [Pseudomassariella vexata]